MENGVVVDESRRTVENKGEGMKEGDMYENFETQDIDEEEKGVKKKVQNHYMKTKNKTKLFQDQNAFPTKSNRETLQPQNQEKVYTEHDKNYISSRNMNDPQDESEEIIMFDGESKSMSQKQASSTKNEETINIPKGGFSTFTINTNLDEANKETPEKSNTLSAKIERDSPGPNRDTFKNTIVK